MNDRFDKLESSSHGKMVDFPGSQLNLGEKRQSSSIPLISRGDDMLSNVDQVDFLTYYQIISLFKFEYFYF